MIKVQGSLQKKWWTLQHLEYLNLLLMGESHCAVAILPLAGDHSGIRSPETNFQYDFGKSAHFLMSLVPFTLCLDYLNFKLYRPEMIYLIVLCLA